MMKRFVIAKKSYCGGVGSFMLLNIFTCCECHGTETINFRI